MRRDWVAAVRLGLIAGLVSACYTSGDPKKFIPARSPKGVAGTVQVVGGAAYQGEVLAVNDSSYVMLIESRVILARYSALSSARFDDVGQMTKQTGEVPARKKRFRLGRYSRFPFGIPAAAMTALLAQSGQSAPDVLKPVP